MGGGLLVLGFGCKVTAAGWGAGGEGQGEGGWGEARGGELSHGATLYYTAYVPLHRLSHSVFCVLRGYR